MLTLNKLPVCSRLTRSETNKQCTTEMSKFSFLHYDQTSSWPRTRKQLARCLCAAAFSIRQQLAWQRTWPPRKVHIFWDKRPLTVCVADGWSHALLSQMHRANVKHTGDVLWPFESANFEQEYALWWVSLLLQRWSLYSVWRKCAKEVVLSHAIAFALAVLEFK